MPVRITYLSLSQSHVPSLQQQSLHHRQAVYITQRLVPHPNSLTTFTHIPNTQLLSCMSHTSSEKAAAL